MTDCECETPGFCERHGIHKTPHWHRLCRTREDYFAAWEQGTGPGQWSRRKGLGDMVEVGLNKIGITKERVAKWTGRPCGGCGRRQRWLNRVGRKIGIGK